MKLKNIQLNLDWPNHIKLNNLRLYIVNQISKKGLVIRWSINEINRSSNISNLRVINIEAVILN